MTTWPYATTRDLTANRFPDGSGWRAPRLPQRGPVPAAVALALTEQFRAVHPPSGWFDVEQPAAAVVCGWFDPAVAAPALEGSTRPTAVPPCELLAEAADILRAAGRHVTAEWVEGWARAVAPMPAAARG